MSDFLIGIGYNVPQANLVAFDPQPTSEGMQAARVQFGLGGAPRFEGLYIELAWGVFEEAADYQANLALCGLSAAVLSAEVTLYAPDLVENWQRWNGLAVLPQARWRDLWLKDVVLMIRNLEAVV